MPDLVMMCGLPGAGTAEPQRRRDKENGNVKGTSPPPLSS